jgi:hypothetical protein
MIWYFHSGEDVSIGLLDCDAIFRVEYGSVCSLFNDAFLETETI